MARTNGAKELSDEQRAIILAQKNLHLGTQGEIADLNGVCRKTVNEMKVETESLEVVARARQIQEDIQKKIERVRDKTLDALENAIDRDELKKEALINAFSTLYDKSRIESGQPTHLTGFSPEQVERFRTGFRNMLVNLFIHFKADEERDAPLEWDEADRLVAFALGETK